MIHELEDSECSRSWGRCEVVANELYLYVTIPRPRPVDDAARCMRVVRRLCHCEPPCDSGFDPEANVFQYTYPNVEHTLDLTDC